MTEQNKNEVLEKKWREEYRLLGFMDGDEIYLAARKAAQVEDNKNLYAANELIETYCKELNEKDAEIIELKKRNEALKYSHDMVSEMNTKKLFELEDRDQEIERLKKENSILYRSHNKICEQLYYGEHLDMEWVKSIIQEEVTHPVITSCLKMKDARDQQLKERDELIKELIDTFDLFDEVPLPFKIVNKMDSVVKKAREVLKELGVEI